MFSKDREINKILIQSILWESSEPQDQVEYVRIGALGFQEMLQQCTGAHIYDRHEVWTIKQRDIYQWSIKWIDPKLMIKSIIRMKGR